MTGTDGAASRSRTKFAEGIDEVDSLRIGPHERVTIVRESPDLLELEAEYDPGGTPPPAHYHPAQDERFEVLAGAVRCRTPDGERELRVGETFDVPRGTPHQFWNGGAEAARLRWQVRPALRTAELFAALARARTPLGKLLVVLRHRREFRLARLKR